MIIGFTGSRHGMTDYQAVIFEGFIGKVDSFHHGGCQGCDVQAARIVSKAFLIKPRIVCHPGPVNDPCQEESGVDDEKREPKTHFARNRDIVNECDELIATPNYMDSITPDTRGGTAYTVNYARKVGKRVTIILPNGSIES